MQANKGFAPGNVIHRVLPFTYYCCAITSTLRVVRVGCMIIIM